MKKHRLKIKPEYLISIIEGNKTFEIRKNDRDFKVGDRVCLVDEENKRYIDIIIKYITDYAQQEGYIVFSFDWISGGKLLGESGVLPMSVGEFRRLN
ncbi:DUF3850 domain-containing protein [Vibrio mediterranei]|uniref:DUF3850 domain-containing protein n=1 Tax=Vibrio mediterranei TaxID=689 RepID=A0A3G4V6V6_9VIBR|nr:DUF3850 domain-containing protein [Vibrio mediterranei]AYV20470.1 DUF3850 domain-containing protein [Vibrio mediterranei]